ncbi:MAG: peptidase [Gemmatimonadota bacterium]|nr:peptidase [Gemmatimonadota bacterium]
MRLRLTTLTTVLLLWAGTLAAQSTDTVPALLPPGGAPPGDSVAPAPPEDVGSRTPAVPQTYDWHRAQPIPATTPWGQPIDVASTELIRSWTTMPEYTNPLVDHLPEHPTVVSPTRHFGYPVGQPGRLHRSDEVHGYLQALAASSPRVLMEWIGATEEGKQIAVVQIGSEANLARLEEVRRGLNQLADPRQTSREEALQIVQRIPVIYTLYAGLHSTETGPPEMVMELAYRLAASDDPLIRTIRDSVVVFIVPVAEPAGRDRVVDWHRRHNRDTFTWDDRVPGPPYWGKYIFHDINRDGLQLTQGTTRSAVRHFLEWKYPIGHDLHESVPYLYTSTGTGPYNATVDPITVSEWHWFANFEVTALTAMGMPGVWTHGFYDGWYPGYLLWVTNTRNAIGRFYETFGSSIPNTIKRTLGAPQTGVEWYRPNPPRRETNWSMRNNTNYMQAGVLQVLHLTAQNRARILEQYWTKASNSVNKGRTEAPYAYVVPVDQARRADAAYMLNLLRRQGIEVHRADAAGRYGDVQVRRGDYVLRMDQPYRNFLLTLMDVQRFPENAPRPYDDVAWTFPFMFNLTVQAVADSAVQRLAMQAVADSIVIPGSARRAGSGGWYLVAPNASAHGIRALYALREVPVYAARDSIRAGGVTMAPGAWMIEAAGLPGDRAQGWATEHGLEVVPVSAGAVRNVQRHRIELPRIALLHTWSRTQDDGWVRYTLDFMGVPYTYLGEDRLRESGLRERFDVILFPTQGRQASGRAIFQGIDPKHSPLPYTQTAEHPSHGTPDSSEDITGGMRFEGLAALRDFIDRGGTLITMGTATNLPIELGLVRGVSTTTPSSLFVPGSIVRGRVEQRRHPLTYGYDETMPLFHQFGPYMNVPAAQRGNVILRYAPTDQLYLSGLVANPGQLGGEPAVVSLPVGQGHVVLFGFNPLHRFQNHGNFALAWNAILHWNQLGHGLGPAGEEGATEGAQ